MSNADGFGGVQLAYNLADLNELQLSKLTWPRYVEPKLDGIRCKVEHTLSGVMAYSKTGKTATSMQHILTELASGMDVGMSLDGEVMSCHDFNTTSGMFRQKQGVALDLKYHVFDVPSESRLSYLERHRFLMDWIKKDLGIFDHIKFVIPRMVTGIDEVYAAYREYRADGYEGLILKDPNATYIPRRHKSWLKLKDRRTTEVVVVDAFEGVGKYVGMLGGFICEVIGDDLGLQGAEVRVGTGFDDTQRGEYWKRIVESPATVGAFQGEVMEIGYHELTGRGSIRHPSFQRWRPEGL